jgi:hypothetical protein
MALMGYSGAWGKLIHEKKPEVENLVVLSLCKLTIWRDKKNLKVLCA